MAANGLHEEEALGKAYDARLMKRLLTYLRPSKGATALAVLMLLIAALAQVALPFLTQYGIDNYIKNKDTHGLGLIALAYFGVMLFMLAATYGQTYISMWLGQRVQFDIRMELYRHLQ